MSPGGLGLVTAWVLVATRETVPVSCTNFCMSIFNKLRQLLKQIELACLNNRVVELERLLKPDAPTP
jgi:hypothetical protein